jgi:hypothetical protein
VKLPFRLVLSVARKFMRSRTVASSTAVLLVVSALMIAMFIMLRAFTLSGEQMVERNLGRFETGAELSELVAPRPGDGRAQQAILSAARAAGARDPMVEIRTYDITVAVADPPVTQYIEADWRTSPFPGRFSLVSGRWPSKAGEVVLTESALEALPPGSDHAVPVLAGNEKFAVVGVTADRYAAYPLILAGSGTWAGIGEPARRAYPNLGAAITLYWNGGEPRSVIEAVGRALDRKNPAAGERVLSDFTSTRETELAADRRSDVERIPLAYGIPSLALPGLAVLLVFGLNRRRFGRSVEVMTSVGMPRRVAMAGLAVATASWALVATVAGSAVGFGIGLLARLLVDEWRIPPLSPLPSLWGPIGRLVIITALTCALATVGYSLAAGWRIRDRRADVKGGRSAVARRQAATGIRRGLAMLLSGVVVYQVAQLSTLPEAMILAGTFGAFVLLLCPEALRLVTAWIPERGPRLRLSRRQLAHDRGRALTAVVVLAAVLGLPLGFLILIDTLIATGDNGLAPEVGQHQLLVSGTGGALQRPPDDAVRAVTDRVEFSRPPIRLHLLTTPDQRLAVHLKEGDGIRILHAVDSVDDVARLTNRDLSRTESETLRSGGLLVWAGDGRPDRHLVVTVNDKITAVSPALSAVVSTFEPAWKTSTEGILLTATAQRLKIPVQDAGLVFTDVSDDEAAAARQAVLDARLDPKQVTLYEPPKGLDLPEVYYASAIGLALLVLATTTAVAQAQVRTLRSYLGRLVSIGLSTRWARQVLLIENAVVVGLATGLALLIAIPAVAVASWRLPNFVLGVPWRWIAMLLVSFVMSTLVSTILSSRRIRASDQSVT